VVVSGKTSKLGRRMSYAKAMRHNRNPRKWKRTRVKDGRGMSLSGQRGQWLVFGKPTTAEAKP